MQLLNVSNKATEGLLQSLDQGHTTHQGHSQDPAPDPLFPIRFFAGQLSSPGPHMEYSGEYLVGLNDLAILSTLLCKMSKPNHGYTLGLTKTPSEEATCLKSLARKRWSQDSRTDLSGSKDSLFSAGLSFCTCYTCCLFIQSTRITLGQADILGGPIRVPLTHTSWLSFLCPRPTAGAGNTKKL